MHHPSHTRVAVISKKPGKIQGFKPHDKTSSVSVDRTPGEVTRGQYEALVLPGGALHADHARMKPRVREFIRLISASVVRNASGLWLDQEVVVDDNLVTSRQPSDLRAFNREMLELFSHGPAGSAPGR